MKPITAPLKLGQTGTEVNNLQEILLLLITHQVINIDGKETLIDRLAEERTGALLGSATNELVLIFRSLHSETNSSGPEIVNTATMSLLNSLLNQIEPPMLTVSGYVRHPSGKQLQGNYVAAVYLLAYPGERLLGNVNVAEDGTYRCLVAIAAGTPNYIDTARKNGIRVKVTDALTNIQVAVQDTYATGADFAIDLVLDGNDIVVATEYEEVGNALQAAIGAPNSIQEIDLTNEDGLTSLATNTGETTQTIRNLVMAYHLHSQIPSIAVDIFYALLRQQLPNTVVGLSTQTADSLFNALKVAVVNHIITDRNDATLQVIATAALNSVNEYLLTGINAIDPKESGLYRIAVTATEGDAEQAGLMLQTYHQWNASSSIPLSEMLHDAGVPDEVTIRFENALRMMVLTGNNGLLTDRLTMILKGVPASGDPVLEGAGEAAAISLLTKLSLTQWNNVIDHIMTNQGFFFPDFIEGGTNDTRKNTYSVFLQKQFDLAAPTHAAATAIAADTATPFTTLKASLQSFLSTNPTFDLRTVPLTKLSEPDAFSFAGIEEKEAFIQEAGIVQRLMNVTDSYPVMAALAADGLHSSIQISRQPPAAFIDAYQLVAGGADAAQNILDAAVQTTNLAFNAIIDFAQLSDGTPFALTQNDPANAFAEWRTLFGSVDSCNCSQCQSVYSPAAYLTDLLQFLKNNLKPAYDVLMERRPDIKDIDLVCKNINTPVPHIDIVNELLEDLVSAVGYTKDSANDYKASSYKMYARQTGADAKIQRAIPEHINTNPAGTGMKLRYWNGSAYDDVFVKNPYDQLKDAVYPASIPYNFYKRQIETHLGIAGVKGYELMQRFSNQNALEIWENKFAAAEYVGISKQELALITVSDANPYKKYGLLVNVVYNPNGEDLYYIADPAARGALYPAGLPFQIVGGHRPDLYARSNWVEHLGYRVDVLLQQAQITYPELQTILDCYCINPFVSSTARKMADVGNDLADDDNPCDLSKRKIQGLDMEAVDRIYRFIRLRKALGWSYYELDQAMIAMARLSDVNARTQAGTIQINEALFCQLVQIERLAQLLNIAVADIIFLWKDLDDILVYSNYEREERELIPSRYQQMFLNPLVGNNELTLFPANANQLDIAVLNTTKDAFYNYLSGIFGIETQDLGLLIHSVFEADSIPATGLPLAQLSKLYREVILLNALNLSVTEWLQYKSWIAIDGNFNAASSSASDAYEKTPSPFTTPYDAIRLVDFVNTVKEAGIDIPDVGYLLLDAFADPVDEITQNGLLQTSLTALRTALQQKSAPVYTAETDIEGEKLKTIVALIADADTTDYLIKVIHDDAAISTDMLTDRIEFLEDSTLAFSPLQSQALTNYTTNVKVRRQLVYDTLKSRIEKAARRPSITNYLAKELKLDEAMITVLLEDCIEVETSGAGPVPAMDLLLDTHFIDSNAVIERSETTTALIPQFVAYVRLQKAAWLINKFKLDLQDVSSLWGHDAVVAGVFRLSTLRVAVTTGTTAIPDVAITGKPPFYQWLGFLRWMQVISFLGKNKNLLYKALRDIPQPLVPTTITVRKERTLKGIAKAFSMPVDDLTVLVGDAATLTGGAFNATFSMDIALPNDYTTAALYLRIIRCLEMQHLLPARMSVLANVAISVADPADQKTANELIQVVKAQYDDDQWLEVVRPVSDQLRIERRDAMVAYLLAYQPWPYKNKWLTSNDIFETLMLDVDMMTCMSTTRVLLAVNTIQLWVDRVLLGLEKYTVANGPDEPLILSAPQARQWNMWRKLYRVWEANRKIFIYPENWIEPELRDDKSPFFKELEKFLKQNDLTADNVEEAYKTYLERLEEVAHLEVIGIYREMNAAGQVVVHAFGRTAANPHIYFYRKRVDTEWTPWEKMEVQIDGDHFIPLVWRGRLRFYWLTFMKEQKDESTAKSKSDDPYVPPAPTCWKINLCFSEYKNGRWTPAQRSKTSMQSAFLYEQDPVNHSHIIQYGGQYSRPTEYSDYEWSLEGTMEKQRKERLTFYAGATSDGELAFYLSERIKVIKQDDMYNAFIEFRTQQNGTYEGPNSNDLKGLLNYYREYEYCTKTFINNIGCFVQKYEGIYSKPNNSVEKNIYYQEGENITMTDRMDLRHNYYTGDNTRFRFDKKDFFNYLNLPPGYFHFPDRTSINSKGPQILSKSLEPANLHNDDMYGRYLVFPLKKPEGYVEGNLISFPSFFFADYKNNFYVEKVYVENVFRNGGNNSEDRPIQYGKPLPKTSLLYRTQYHFQEFSHGTVDNFRECLYKNGLDALLNRDFINQLNDEITFSTTYSPTTYVLQGTNGTKYPNSKVDFSLEGAYSLYNWELFFHIPMLIANKLTQDQKFDEARKWYHYVFNPTVGGSNDVKNFWNFPEFNKNAHSIPTPLQLMRDPQLGTAVTRWANDPFKPHLIARTRISAYMKNTFMKYLDNLIAWGDNLYRSDTRENVNEATLLYVLAAQLMGRKPVNMSAKSTPDAQSYISLAYLAATNGLNAGGLNAFSNGVLYAENLVLSTGATSVSVVPQPGTPQVLTDSMFYFCIPANDKLRGYWDIIADRLFKIRHCQNIDGVERELALYDPPIDPALLVKAAAAGISLNDVLADINAPIPAYRFNVMSQKATELTQEVKSLGGQLLSALEKKDAEKISLLRSGQELSMLALVTEVKEQQVQDSVTQINGLQQQQKITTQRRDYYNRLIDSGLNVQEQLQLDSLQISIPLNLAQGSSQTTAGILGVIPNVKIGAPTTAGATFGGSNLSSIASAAASAFGAIANVNSTIGQMAGTKGSYVRRKEDWAQQLKTAEAELKQLDHQILGAQIRRAISELELRNHKTQMANAQQMDEAMRNKYTNEELYDWMVGEISLTYFQAYKLAMDVAKRAERCYRYELGMESSDFIQSAYWDSLKKGLLAGEQLMFDVKRMEVSFLDKNKRQLELTKHVSLAQLCPDELLKLKTGKKCDISIPEWLFDMDYPGQHLRRIKSVSVSIPCVAGPYTTVSCKLSLVSSKYRKSSIMVTNYNHEDNFKQLYGSIQSIATSSAQNDSGMFEFSFRDERYLPFEGAGAISKWRIELPAVYAQFDYNSISDVILHINYSALDEGSLKGEAVGNVTKVLQSAAADNGFMRLFNVKHEFADEWFAYSEAVKNDPDAKLTIRISDQHFPYYTQGKKIEVRGMQFGMKSDATLTGRLQLQYRNGLVYKPSVNVATVPYCPLQPVWEIEGNTKILKMQLFNTASAPANLTTLLDDLYLIVVCRLKDDLTGHVNDDADWGYTPDSIGIAPQQLAVPGFTATPGNGNIKLTWTNSGARTTYLIERSLKPTFPSYATKAVYSGTDLTTTIEGLTNGKPVYFRIKAMNDEGNPDSGYGFADSKPTALLPLMHNLDAWWMADAGISTASGEVTLWKDQSGSGYDLMPASSSTRPPISSDGLNGIDAVAFNGHSALYTTHYQDTQSYTLTMLVKVEAFNTTGLLGRDSSEAINSVWTLWLYNGKYVPFNYVNEAFYPNYTDIQFDLSINQWDIITVRRDAMTGIMTTWKNGIKLNDYACGNTFGLAANPISIGSLGENQHYGYFKMLEGAIYNVALTDEEIDSNHDYYRNKYGLQVSTTSNFLAWWSADAVDNVMVGNQLSVWKDQSGRGNDIAAADVGKRPALINNWKNGQPALNFNGGQGLRKAMLDLPANTVDISVFFVGKKKDTSIQSCVFELSDNLNLVANGLGFFTNQVNIDSAILKVGGEFNIHGMPMDVANDIPGVYEIGFNLPNPDPETSVTFNGTKYQVPYGNSYPVQADHLVEVFNSNPLNIGTRGGGSELFAYFELAEMIIIPEKVSDKQRTAITNYLKAKYAL